jgi:hypothetical protein
MWNLVLNSMQDKDEYMNMNLVLNSMQYKDEYMNMTHEGDNG